MKNASVQIETALSSPQDNALAAGTELAGQFSTGLERSDDGAASNISEDADEVALTASALADCALQVEQALQQYLVVDK
jgi:hypothetical protein